MVCMRLIMNEVKRAVMYSRVNLYRKHLLVPRANQFFLCEDRIVSIYFRTNSCGETGLYWHTVEKSISNALQSQLVSNNGLHKTIEKAMKAVMCFQTTLIIESVPYTAHRDMKRPVMSSRINLCRKRDLDKA